ncbi:MAG: hypothetical protein V5A33_05895 [Halobacteriales archaeon]
MLFVRGRGGGTELTGTLYERGDPSPDFRGTPDEDAAYVLVCDEFYEVESGGVTEEVDGEEIQIAFESPMPRGFETRAAALEGAEEHVRTQFARIGVDPETVEVEVVTAEPPEP